MNNEYLTLRLCMLSKSLVQNVGEIDPWCRTNLLQTYECINVILIQALLVVRSMELNLLFCDKVCQLSFLLISIFWGDLSKDKKM